MAATMPRPCRTSSTRPSSRSGRSPFPQAPAISARRSTCLPWPCREPGCGIPRFTSEATPATRPFMGTGAIRSTPEFSTALISSLPPALGPCRRPQASGGSSNGIYVVATGLGGLSNAGGLNFVKLSGHSGGREACAVKVGFGEGSWFRKSFQVPASEKRQGPRTFAGLCRICFLSTFY